MKTKLLKWLVAALVCVLPIGNVQASESEPVSVEGLYSYNDKAFGYTLNEGKGTTYVISREDIPCFINFKSALLSQGSDKTVKVIPVISKIGYDEEKLEKNNYLLYFYLKAMKTDAVGFPFILTEKNGQIIMHQGCPDMDNWDTYFYN